MKFIEVDVYPTGVQHINPNQIVRVYSQIDNDDDLAYTVIDTVTIGEIICVDKIEDVLEQLKGCGK